jgi:hypothetical protein
MVATTTTLTQQAAIVASRIVRMRQARERTQHDPAARALITANLRTATAALRSFNRARRVG